MFGLLATIFNRETADGNYECQHCGARFDIQHHCCPQCEGFSIERTEWTATAD